MSWHETIYIVVKAKMANFDLQFKIGWQGGGHSQATAEGRPASRVHLRTRGAVCATLLPLENASRWQEQRT